MKALVHHSGQGFDNSPEIGEFEVTTNQVKIFNRLSEAKQYYESILDEKIIWDLTSFPKLLACHVFARMPKIRNGIPKKGRNQEDINLKVNIIKSFKRKDIIQKIRTDFKASEVEEVKSLLKGRDGNVGRGQFMRSVLFLAKGNMEALKKILNAGDDPREIVMSAEIASGELGHWFSIPFDEIEALNGSLYTGNIFESAETEHEEL